MFYKQNPALFLKEPDLKLLTMFLFSFIGVRQR